MPNINADQYKELMNNLEQLAKREFAAKDLDQNLQDFLDQRQAIEANEITRTGPHTQAAVGAMVEANQKLKSELAVVNENKWATATISAAAVAALSSVIGLGLAANEVSKNKDDDNTASSNDTLIATTLLSTLSSIVTAISYVVDYSNNAKKIELSRTKSSEELRKLARALYVEVNRNELDKLINNLSPQDRERNEIRIKYWEEFHQNHKGNIGRDNPDQAMTLLYSAIAIASYYSVGAHKDLAKVKQILEESVSLIKKYAGLDSDHQYPVNDLVENYLQPADKRLPTIYAKTLYQLGRMANIDLAVAERDKLKTCLKDCDEVRKLIDANHLDAGGNGKYDDCYSDRKIADSLLFKRSGLLEFDLRETEDQIKKRATTPIDENLTKQKLNDIYDGFEQSREDGKRKGGDSSHDFVCKEKMVRVLNLSSRISNHAEIENLANTAKTILFYTNDATEQNLQKILNDSSDKERMILRSAANFVGILSNSNPSQRILIHGKPVDYESLNQFILQHKNIGKYPEVKEECDLNSAAIAKQKTPSVSTSASAAAPVVANNNQQQTNP